MRSFRGLCPEDPYAWTRGHLTFRHFLGMQFEARKLLGRRGGLPRGGGPPAALPRGLLTRLRDSDPHAKGTANRAGRPYETLVAWAPGGLKLERAFLRKMSAATVVPPSMSMI